MTPKKQYETPTLVAAGDFRTTTAGFSLLMVDGLVARRVF